MLQSQPLGDGNARMKVACANLLPPVWFFIFYVGFSLHGCPILFPQTPSHIQSKDQAGLI